MDTRQLPGSEFHISDSARDELLDELMKIREELRTPIETIETKGPYLHSAKLAQDLGITISFNKWMLQQYDIDATPEELPKLKMTYIYIGDSGDV